MKKSKLKIMLILSVFLALAMILCIFIFKNPKDKQEYNIDKKYMIFRVLFPKKALQQK